MKQFIGNILPKSGLSPLLHVVLNILLALAVFVLVRIEFVGAAFVLVLLSKWRMFVVRPRFWPANLRVNAVDLIVSLSVVLFMIQTGSALVQLAWAGFYVLWLLVVKPGSSTFWQSLQSTLGLGLGLVVLFYALGDLPVYWLVLMAGLICYFASRHFFDSFEEPYAKLLSSMFSFFGAALTWVMGHWLLFYLGGVLAQPALLLIAAAYGLAALYYLDHFDRLSRPVKVEIMVVSAVITVAIIASLTVNAVTTINDLLG